MLVVLRLSLGCHFLYEGVWKIKNADEFTAEPFLTQAKGPASPLFYTMIYDIDGRQRLALDEKEKIKMTVVVTVDPKKAPEEKKLELIGGRVYIDAWRDLIDRAIARYGMDEAQQQAAQKVFDESVFALDGYLKDNKEEIQQYLKGLGFDDKAREQPYLGWPTSQERLWKRQEELRSESKKWLSELDKYGKSIQQSLWQILNEEQRAKGWIGNSWNPLHWSRIELINFAVTYGLTAIGLCLMIGFFTRFAALGGAGFMLFVCLTQPGWPTIYPHAPPVVGHSLLVTKDFLEMVSLLLVACTAVGTWGGLDYFLYNCICVPLRNRFCKCKSCCETKAA